MAVYVPCIWLGTWTLDFKGLKVGVLVGAILTALGALVRGAAVEPYLFFFLYIGQAILSIAQVFILEVPPKLAAAWFGPSQRSSATSVGLLSNNCGIAAGFFIAPLIVKKGTDIKILMWVVGGVATIVAVLVVIFFKANPPSPPSASSELRDEHNDKKKNKTASSETSSGSSTSSSSSSDTPPAINDKTPLHQQQVGEEEITTEGGGKRSILRDIKSLFFDPNYVLLTLTFGVSIGIFYAISTVIEQILDPYGYSESQTGIIGVLMVIVGIAGALLAGLLADYTKKYKLLMKLSYFGALVSLIAFFASSIEDNYIALCFCASSFGFFITALLPLVLELGVECTYPIPEGLSAGILLLFPQLFGVILIIYLTLLKDVYYTFSVFDDYRFNIGSWSCVVALGISSFLTLVFNGSYKRLAVE